MNPNEANDAKQRGRSQDPLPSQSLSEEDDAALEDGQKKPNGGLSEEDREAVDDQEAKQTSGVPDWVVVPANFKWPKKGKQVYFVRFLAPWTDTPEKGDRHAILFGLSEADEKIARKRAAADKDKTLAELTKQMIRAIDGEAVDWTGKFTGGNPTLWWRDIGYRCRQELQSIFVKTHQFTQEEKQTFFVSCLAVMSVGD